MPERPMRARSRVAGRCCIPLRISTQAMQTLCKRRDGVMADAPARKKVTINTLMAKMKKGEPITQLAAYDYRTAVIADRLGMDILCVSDTGGMILFGHKSTVSVSFDEVMMMSKAIDRGSKYGLRMVDMPYWSFHVSKEEAVENAGRFVHEANAEVMNCEGNKYHAPNIEAIVRAGVPV